jgi:hypothetical protein
MERPQAVLFAGRGKPRDAPAHDGTSHDNTIHDATTGASRDGDSFRNDQESPA